MANNVYVIGGRRYLKIGVANDVQTRLSGIQTGCPFALRIIQQWRTGRARQIEKLAHRMLGKYRSKGEWFAIPARVATLAVGMLVAANPSRGSADSSLQKAIVFCGNCEHSGVMQPVPPVARPMRCSKCHKNDHVHVIDCSLMLTVE